jgi:hypothetical protein
MSKVLYREVDACKPLFKNLTHADDEFIDGYCLPVLMTEEK